jgi:hypothetical protein
VLKMCDLAKLRVSLSNKKGSVPSKDIRCIMIIRYHACCNYVTVYDSGRNVDVKSLLKRRTSNIIKILPFPIM